MESVIHELEKFGLYGLIGSGDSGGGSVVILAHGIGADLTEDRSPDKPGLFDLTVAKILDKGLDTVRFDFRGHGKSAKVDGYPSVSSEVEDLKHVIDYVVESGLHLEAIVGCSFGACATSVVVAEKRDEIRSVVLINPVIRPLETFINPGSEWARQSFTQEALSALNDRGVLMLDGEFPLGKDFVRDVSSIAPSELLSGYGGRLAIAHGTADTYVPFGYSQQFANSMNSTFLAVTGAEHGFGKIKDREFVATFIAEYIGWANDSDRR